MFDNDLVRDILRRVIDAASREGSFTESLAVEIERQVRRDWSGETVYVASAPPNLRRARDDKIRDAWESGQRDVRMLAARFGLSQRQIRRIVGE